MKSLRLMLLLLLGLLPLGALAAPEFTALRVSPPSEDGSQTYSVTLQVLGFMTAMTFLPLALMMMTSFARIIIVLAILRQALGTMSTPSNQILLGLSLFLTVFIMMPVFDRAYEQGLKPYMDEQVSLQQALETGSQPFREFMMAQTRDSDIGLFAEISGAGELDTPDKVPFSLLMPAFLTSELKTAFQIGFLIMIPFLIIDLVVASLLMAMGMMMLSPMIISLPFKIMLFVLIDGWSLVMGTLATSFYV